MSTDQARVVVIGGGITGCSVAYHLAEAGWIDVLLVEKPFTDQALLRTVYAALTRDH